MQLEGGGKEKTITAPFSSPSKGSFFCGEQTSTVILIAIISTVIHRITLPSRGDTDCIVTQEGVSLTHCRVGIQQDKLSRIKLSSTNVISYMYRFFCLLQEALDLDSHSCNLLNVLNSENTSVCNFHCSPSKDLALLRKKIMSQLFNKFKVS